MTKYSQNLLWSVGIKPVLDEILNDLLPNDIEKFHVERIPDEKYKAVLFQTYDESRIYIKEHFFDVGADDDNLIDCHKVCSCIVYSLLKNRFLVYDLRSDISDELLLSNYKAAFLGGTRCLFVLSVARLQKYGKIELAKCLWRKGAFVFPETNKGHDSYVIGRAKSFGLNETYDRDFDYLACSDMLFWIEKYNLFKVKEESGSLIRIG